MRRAPFYVQVSVRSFNRGVGDISYLTVEQGHILNPGVLNNILDTRVLSDTSHAYTVGVIAPQVLHKDVGSVWLGREAVVTNVDAGVGHAQAVHVQGVESVGVLGQSLEHR